MAISFIPYEELFAPEYQLTYISTDGHIDVGPNTYSVFHAYTMTERQQIFQVCEKHLPWQFSEEQEHWERTMYMYQFVIKSPPPFPYEQYILSEDIIMAISWDTQITGTNIAAKRADVTFTRIDDAAPLDTFVQQYSNVIIETPEQRLALLDQVWGAWQQELIDRGNLVLFLNGLEQSANSNLDSIEV